MTHSYLDNLYFDHSNWNSLIRFHTVQNRSVLYCSVLSVRFDSDIFDLIPTLAVGDAIFWFILKRWFEESLFYLPFWLNIPPTPQSKLNIFSKTGKPPEIQTFFIFKNIITWQISKRQRPGGQIIITVGFKEINAKYTSKEKMSMPMSIPFISLRTFKILLGQGQVVKWPSSDL